MAKDVKIDVKGTAKNPTTRGLKKGLEKDAIRRENCIKWIAKDAIRNKDIPS